jgi:hypothetical protein
MQKAHLYEAILLVNRGVDEAVRGLERLKRAKDSQLDSSCFDEELVLFEEEQAKKKKRAARKKASAANRSKVRPARHEKRPRVVVTPASQKGAKQ